MLIRYRNIFCGAGLFFFVFVFLYPRAGLAAIGESLSGSAKDLPEATSSSQFVLPGGALTGLQLNSLFRHNVSRNY
jgi:hypothetical protein